MTAHPLDRRFFWQKRAFALACALLLGLPLSGCTGGEAPEKEAASPEHPPGHFEAEVRGALRDTLRGEAVARLDSAGHLAGLELDDASDTTKAGLSFELAPLPAVRTRTYTVRRHGRSEEETAASVPLMNAYLRMKGYEFAAQTGSLRVARSDTTGGLQGAYEITLRGLVNASSDDPATVAMSGSFRAVRPLRRPEGRAALK